jgi:hypothetical protein
MGTAEWTGLDEFLFARATEHDKSAEAAGVPLPAGVVVKNASRSCWWASRRRQDLRWGVRRAVGWQRVEVD